MDGVALTFDRDAFEYIVDKAIEFKLGGHADCVLSLKQ